MIDVKINYINNSVDDTATLVLLNQTDNIILDQSTRFTLSTRDSFLVATGIIINNTNSDKIIVLRVDLPVGGDITLNNNSMSKIRFVKI